MENNELLKLYLEKLRLLSLDALEQKETISVLEALKKAIIILEGEMSGYMTATGIAVSLVYFLA